MPNKIMYICYIALCPNKGKKCWEHSPYNVDKLCPHMNSICDKPECTQYVK